MRPTHFVGIIFGDDGRAAQRRDEEFRAWHRRPDALPLPEEPPARKAWRFPIVSMLVRSVAVLGVFGRKG